MRYRMLKPHEKPDCRKGDQGFIAGKWRLTEFFGNTPLPHIKYRRPITTDGKAEE